MSSEDDEFVLSAMLDAPAHRLIHSLHPPCTAISPLLPYPSKLTASHDHQAPQHPPHLDTDTSLAPVSSLRIVSIQKCPLATTSVPNRAPNAAGHYGSRSAFKIPRTGSYCQFADGSTAGWDGFASVLWRASASCGRICGTGRRVSLPCGWLYGPSGQDRFLPAS